MTSTVTAVPVATPVYATPVAQPVGTAVAPAQQNMAPMQMQAAPGPVVIMQHGMLAPMQAANLPAFLQAQNGLYVRQELELMEILSGCETKNRYTISNIGRETLIPNDPDSSWSERFRMQAGYAPLLKGKEESECCNRVCCPLFREFEMTFWDGANQPFFKLDRPFKFDFCYCQPMCHTTQQEMSLSTNGQTVAIAKETTGQCCTTGCCGRQFTTYDGTGKEMYTLKANDCTSSSAGCNFCAPSFCNESFTIDVYDSAGQLVGGSPSTFVFPGCNCGGLQDLSNMVVNFPPNASDQERAGLITGMFLIEFAVMELRRQNNNNNGGGGGPSQNEEMVR